MDAKELAKKEPMATPGFTVIIPKAETEYDKMILEKQMSACDGCEGERPVYPAPTPEPQKDAPAPTEKKNSKRGSSD
jgi:hypothetical protein